TTPGQPECKSLCRVFTGDLSKPSAVGSGLDATTRAAGRCGSATENKAPAWQLRITFHRRPRLRLRSWPLHRSFARKGDVRFFVFASLGTLLGQRYGLFRRIARAAK